LAAVGRRAADLGLVLEVGTKGSTPGHLRWHLDLCDQVNAKLLRVVPDDEEPAADLIATLRALTTRLQAREVVVAVENHFRLKPAELAQIIAAVDHPHVGICLDPLNSISQLIGPAEVVATLAPYALSVHVKDAVTARRGTGFCITGCPIGEGMVDIRGMVASLKQQRRSPNLVVESWMDPAQNPEATAVQEQQWTRQGISYLQGVI